MARPESIRLLVQAAFRASRLASAPPLLMPAASPAKVVGREWSCWLASHAGGHYRLSPNKAPPPSSDGAGSFALQKESLTWGGGGREMCWNWMVQLGGGGGGITFHLAPPNFAFQAIFIYTRGSKAPWKSGWFLTQACRPGPPQSSQCFPVIEFASFPTLTRLGRRRCVLCVCQAFLSCLLCLWFPGELGCC